MAFYDIDGNEFSLDSSSDKVFWNNRINAPYWILYLDCGRKYFSVANVKLLIDAMSNAGMNQLTLLFSANEGFRFALNNMIVSANNTTYDLTPCLGGSESPSNWYTEADMDEIISYAQGKGIDIVPSLDMPGHMGRILSQFTSFKLENTTTLNIKNPSAVNFAKAIVEKYASYFASRGCHWYSMCYDEIMGWSVGFPKFYNNGEFQYVVDFANELSAIIKSHGMIPRAFNELIHYNNDFDYHVDRDIEVMYWDGSIQNESLSMPSTLQSLGYTLINSNEKYYWVLNSTRQATAEYLENANLLRGFDVETTSKNCYGAQFCIWCDNPTSTQSGDGGTGVVTAVTPLIAAFGKAISNAMKGIGYLDGLRSDRLLIWHDEFDKPTLDETKWSNVYGDYRGYNWNSTDMMRNISSGKGMSFWTAKDYPNSVSNFSGAYVHTREKFEFMYGRIEAKMRFPSASPHHTTFWTLGSCGAVKSTGEDTRYNDTVGVKFPSVGEIDIAEYDNQLVGARMHWSNQGFDTDQYSSGGNVNSLTSTPTDWHIYACEWTESAITFYVDGVQKGTWNTSNATVNGWNPFNHPHYLIFDCISALSGTIDWDVAKTDVAWVRVYAPADVTEYITETAISITENIDMRVGARVWLEPTFTPANPSDMTIQWSSGNEEICTCYGGMVIGVGAGTTVVTAKTKHGLTAFCKVTVIA